MVDKRYFVEEVSTTEPVWEREKVQRWWDPGRQLIDSVRCYQSAKGVFARPNRIRQVLRHRFWTVVTGADIPLNAQIGGGFFMPHPNGIVIHPDAQIGINCLLFQQVTIAGKAIIGNHVDVGAGAKVLGPLTIGDHVQVGANAVVTSDVPSGTIVAGVPAKPI